MHLPLLTRESLFPLSGNLKINLILTHWSPFFDLSIDDRAIGDLPNERLAIESLRP